MPTETWLWWMSLCAVSVFNVLAWSLATKKLALGSSLLRPSSWSITHWQVLLSLGYVLGCAYRSAFPVYDVQRLAIVDSWLSSVVVGRTVATVAELCFAAQWAILLHSIGRRYASTTAITVSQWIVPMIVVAETFSWYAVLTTSNIGHVVEETLWGACAAMLVASLVYVWPRANRSDRPLLAVACVVGAGYVVYMFWVDVPMYWARWILDESRSHPYLDLAQGLTDVSNRWLVSHHWHDWKSEVVWMSLYFSVAVWLSISLMHVAHAMGARTAAVNTAPEGQASQKFLHHHLESPQ